MYQAGQKYGTNILIERDIEKSKTTHKTYWKCKCELCDEIRSIRTDNLNCKCRSCAAKLRNGPQDAYFKVSNDLTGKIFGFWKVVGKADKSNYWNCQCMNCGTIKEVFRGNLTQGLSKGCGCTKSWGEAQIIYLLDYWKINYKREYTFPDLITDKGGHPRFDFAIFQNNKLAYLIEYDGRQHYNYNNNWNMTKEEFQRLQDTDKLKTEYCQKNKIPLYRFTKNSSLEEEIKELVLNKK